MITKNHMSRNCVNQILKQNCKHVGILQNFAHIN